MAEPTQQQPTGDAQNSLFSLLAARYGVMGALQLMGLIDPNASLASRAFGGAQLGRLGLSALGNLGGVGGAAELAKAASLPLGLAGTGYGIYNIASDPNLSNTQKAGHAAGTGINAGLSVAVPYYGLGVAAKTVIDQLRKSGSPQVAATGRALGGPALPVEGLLSVLQGDQSPRAAFNSMVENIKQVPVLGKPAGAVMKIFGLGTEPTTGTKFRTELESVLNQIPQLKGVGRQQYNIDPEYYKSLNPETIKAGETLGKLLAAYAPTGAKNPEAYWIQAQNLLLNKFGNDLPGLMNQVLPMLRGEQQQPQGTPQPSPTSPAPAAGAVPMGILGGLGGLPAAVQAMLARARTA